MYPGPNNYNNQYPHNQNSQPGFNAQQPGYPYSSGGPPIGFNIGQPDYNQGIAPQNVPYGGYNQACQQQMPMMGNYQIQNSTQNAPYNMYNQSQIAEIPNQFQNQFLPTSGFVQPQTHHQTQPGGYQTQPGGYQIQPQTNHQSQPGAYQIQPPISHNVGSNWQLGYDTSSQYVTPQTSYTQHTDLPTNLDKIGSGGEIYKGTIKPHTNFSAEQDANVLRKAMKGIGTDENAIIECLGRRSWAQRLEIKKTFKTMFGKDLIDELKSELSGDFSRAVRESLFDPDYYDAYSLRKAMEGLGTRENVLTEILTSRTNQQIENIKLLYKKWFNRNLEKDVVSETSGFYKRVLVSALQANKKELSDDEINRVYQNGHASIISINQARQEAQELYNAGEKKLGTDEACFIKIFALRNRYQLRATFDEYQKIAGRDIFSSIDREMSGDLATALKAIAMQAINPPLYFANNLFKSMKGAGTNDTSLIRILLTRSEIDLENIKSEFQKQFGKSLDSFVRGDTSGDYQKFLLRFVQGN